MTSSSLRNLPRKAWDSVRDSGTRYPSLHFLYLAVSALFFWLAYSNRFPVSFLLPAQAATFVFGLSYVKTGNTSLIRLGTGISSMALAISVARLSGPPQGMALFLSVGALCFIYLPVWQAVVVLGLGLYSVWNLSASVFQRNLLVFGLSLSFVPMVWTNFRRRKTNLGLETRIRSLEARTEGTETDKTSATLGPALSEAQFAGMLRVLTDTEETLKQMLPLARGALGCQTLALYRFSGSRLRLEHYDTESEAPLRPYLTEDLATLVRTHPKTKAFALSRTGDEEPTLYREVSGKAAQSLLIMPLLEGPVVTGALMADSLEPNAFKDNHKGTLTCLAGHLALQRTRGAMITELGHAARASAAMVEISHLLLGNIMMAELPDRLLEGVRLVVDVPFLAFFSIRGSRFQLRASSGFPRGKRSVFSGKDNILGWIHRHGAKYHISDLTNRPVNVLPLSIPGLRTFLGLPLIYEDRCRGILVAGSDHADAFSARDIHMLESVVLQAATAMANATLHSRIEKMALTDGLTGLYNHQNFQVMAARVFERLRRFPEPLSILLLDIDHFKKINDTWGHPAGDSVLKEVAGIIRKTLRRIDIPARYGGEEFAALLLRADQEGAFEMAERLRTRIEGHRFRTDSGEIGVTVSIGIATFPVDGHKKEVLVERADQALYQSKNSGRNRTTCASDLQTL